MKTLLRILVPSFIVFLGYLYLKPLWATIFMFIVIAAVIFIYRVDIYMMLAKYNYIKNNDKMFDLLEKAYKTGKMNPEQKLYYGYMCMREGKLQKAEKLFNAVSAYKQTPEIRAKVKLNHALLSWKRGNINEAIEETEEVFEDYKTTVVYGNLGFLYLESGNLQKALEFNKEAYEYNADDAVISDNLAQTYVKLGQYDKSREIYDKFVDAKITSPTLLYNMAKTFAETGDKERAAGFLKEALKLHFAGVACVEKEAVESYLEELQGTPEVSNN